MEFTDLLLRDKDFAEALNGFQAGNPISVDAVFGGACALTVAAIARKVPLPVLLLAPSTDRAERVAEDLELFTEAEVALFPALSDLPAQLLGPISEETPTAPEENFSEALKNAFEDDFDEDLETPNIFALADDLFGQRVRLLKRLDSKEAPPAIIVSTVSALLQPVPTRSLIREKTQTLRVGDRIDLDAFRRFLVQGGYHATSAIDLPGEFAVRGHILDLFAPDWEQPVRIELFDDEIESIRRFDIATQRSLQHISEIDLTTLPPGEATGALFFDYLPGAGPILLLEPLELEQSGRTYLERLGHPPALPTVSDLMKRILRRPTASFSNLAEGLEDLHVRLPVSSVERLHGNLETVCRELDLLDDVEIFVFCPTEAETQRLSELFAKLKPMREGRLHFRIGRLSGGFKLRKPKKTPKSKGPAEALILIGSGELFERHDLRRPRRRRLGQVIDSFLDLKPGDFVVHVGHGIAKYRGIKLMKSGQHEEEHLHLEFAGSQALYIPVSKMSLVQKYIGGTKHRPRLARLGGLVWDRSKKAVQDAVFDLADEMIRLQATRQALPGTAFPVDSDWQHEFDASFPFRETDDQLSAIEAVKHDMELPRPMDRLLCGDVGFGKTEVAIRAAFKAVDAGYQVAVLVPTTILAEQHARTFSERMREFPVTIAALSRFQTRNEQKRIVEDLAAGRVDIIIGTHRIVSKDIAFRNLGLVVIDEEQRFGVQHKERLKTFRESVDVLTMTATPIPRTLHFSLLGIREISNLETPPEDRLAVETRVIRFNEDIIRTAVLRELNRDGQIYFVHNRVHDIDHFAGRIQRIVPECRIGIGHAQMPVEELERIMGAFIRHEFDMLISTTIIESGLDIPNANTMFIDEASRYGLADLHQLRGRVGRFKHQAYCYLLLGRDQMLHSQAAKRLHAIEEYAHLGSGFHLAMRDLEIRGAGNILGTQQSGHIAAVGYEMYCQFLEAAVRSLKSLPPKEVVDVELDLPGLALIPMTFVADHRLKIDLYRRLTRITTLDEWYDLREEIHDRFGTPPIEVRRLLTHSRIRVLAHGYRIRSVRVDPDEKQVVFEYVSLKELDRLYRRLEELGHSLRFTGDNLACVALPPEQARSFDPDSILRLIVEILEQPKA